MHTLGGVILAVIGVAGLHAIFGMVGSFLAIVMLQTADMHVIPAGMLIALQACGVYGGVYFSAKVVGESNLRVVLVFVLLLLTVGSFYQAFNPVLEGVWEWIGMLSGYISNCFAAYLATTHAGSERGKEPGIQS